MSFVKFVALVAAIVVAAWQVRDLQWSIRGLSERVAAIDGKVSTIGPAVPPSEVRRICRELIETSPLACSWVRGKRGSKDDGSCKFYHPREEPRDE